MRKLAVLLFGLLPLLVFSQNVGIGTSSPIARLHVIDSNVVFSANRVTSDPASFTAPVEGSGTRLMWMPAKSAFRAGSVTFNLWNSDRIGLYSTAFGNNNIANGFASTAMGGENVASGPYSTTIGIGNVASGIISLAGGQQSIASGTGSVAFGFNTRASGSNSFASGYSAVASGNQSFSFGDATVASFNNAIAFGAGTKSLFYFTLATGQNTEASGWASSSFGVDTKAQGYYTISGGIGTIARSYVSTVLGMFNDSVASSNQFDPIPTDPLFILGNGSAPNNRSNALVVYKNGNTDINGYTQLGKTSEGAPAIKQKKIIGFNTPSSANPNSWTFVPHGVNASKILSISVLVTAPGGFDILPHSPDAGAIYTVNTDPTGGGAGPSIAIGVKSAVQSGNVMGRPIKILITYEE